jgi:hypothetical protein
MKKSTFILIVWAVLLLCVVFSFLASKDTSYAVLLGIDPEHSSCLSRYKTVVIDAQYFTKEEISAVQQKGTKVYTYLNVGSVETFREGYDSLKSLVLSPYDNWPDEYWVDVSKPEWRTFVADEAKSLAEKGVDGFFLDNADVYYLYPNDAIFDGLSAILSDLAQYGKPVLINGGDTFVSRAVLDAKVPNAVITGVNQECVFTNIDFDAGTLIRQDADTTSYYQEYLTQCRKAGLSVYLTEYAKPGDNIARRIDGYCKGNGYLYYISPSINLDQR